MASGRSSAFPWLVGFSGGLVLALGSAVVMAQGGITPGDENRVSHQQRIMQEADIWLRWVENARQSGDCEAYESANELYLSRFAPAASDFTPEWVRDFQARYQAMRARGCTARRQASAASNPALICPRTFNEDVERNGGVCRCDESTLTMTGTNSWMWGTGVYTGDSHLCYAAVHAGVIPASGGMIRVARGPGYNSFPGSDQNGHASGTYGRFSWSISFGGSQPMQSRPLPPPLPQFPAAPAPQSAAPAAATHAGGVQSCPAFYPGSALQAAGSGECRCSQPGLVPVYGTGDYTADSDICRAAQHAGVIPAQGGMVRVSAAPGRSSYRGSTRNGVETLDWRRNDASFRVSAVVGPQATQPVPVSADASAAPAGPPGETSPSRPVSLSGFWRTHLYGEIQYWRVEENDGDFRLYRYSRTPPDVSNTIRGTRQGNVITIQIPPVSYYCPPGNIRVIPDGRRMMVSADGNTIFSFVRRYSVSNDCRASVRDWAPLAPYERVTDPNEPRPF